MADEDDVAAGGGGGGGGLAYADAGAAAGAAGRLLFREGGGGGADGVVSAVKGLPSVAKGLAPAPLFGVVVVEEEAVALGAEEMLPNMLALLCFSRSAFHTASSSICAFAFLMVGLFPVNYVEAEK